MIDGKTTSRPFTTNGNEQDTVLTGQPSHLYTHCFQRHFTQNPRLGSLAGLRRIEAQRRHFRAVDDLPSASALRVQTNASTIQQLRRFTVRADQTQRTGIPNLRPERLHRAARNQSECGARHTADSRRGLRGQVRAPNTPHRQVQSDGLQLRVRSVRVALQDLPDAASDLKPPSRAPFSHPLQLPTLKSTGINAPRLMALAMP